MPTNFDKASCNKARQELGLEPIDEREAQTLEVLKRDMIQEANKRLGISSQPAVSADSGSTHKCHKCLRDVQPSFEPQYMLRYTGLRTVSLTHWFHAECFEEMAGDQYGK